MAGPSRKPDRWQRIGFGIALASIFVFALGGRYLGTRTPWVAIPGFVIGLVIYFVAALR